MEDIRHSPCLPLALTAVHTSSWPQPQQAFGYAFTFHHENILGTSLEIRIRARDLAAAQNAEIAALEEFDRQERILSLWRSDRELSHWASTRFIAMPISPDLYRTLAQFDLWREKTDGALDPSVEAAGHTWRGNLAEGRSPSAAEIRQVLETIRQPHWSLDPIHRTATRLTDVPLTFASFVKSSIASSAADTALATGASGVMLTRAIGAKPWGIVSCVPVSQISVVRRHQDAC